MHTYGIPDDEVIASIIDVFVVLHEIAQGEIVLVRHIVARIARRGDVERADWGVLFRAEIVTPGESAGVAAYRVGEKGTRSRQCAARHILGGVTYSLLRGSWTLSQMYSRCPAPRSLHRWRCFAWYEEQ